MLSRTIRWVLFFWSAAAAFVSAYAALHAVGSQPGIYRTDALIGVGFWLFLGSPALITLPIIVTCQWQDIGRFTRVVQLSPSVLTVVAVAVVLVADLGLV